VISHVDGDLVDDLCSAQCALLVSGGVLLREHALYMFVLAANAADACIAYCDEDHCDESGERSMPLFKPDFSPALFASRNYLGNCILLRGSSAFVRSAVGCFVQQRSDVEGAIDELIANIDPGKIVHIPHILYHDIVEPLSQYPLRDLESPNGVTPSVSIVVPTRDQVGVLRACLESITRKTEYPAHKFEIVVIDNDSCERETIEYFASVARSGNVRVVKEPGAFNFSKLNNRVAEQCDKDVLVFLNNDTVVIDPMWLRRLVSVAALADVGAVGGKLLYPDGTVQHGGVLLGIHNSAVHSHVGIDRDDPGFQGLASLTREVSAVTAACLAIRRSLFQTLGGFDEELAISFNDTDLCLRALDLGFRNVYIGTPLLTHFESKTRGRDDTSQKIAIARWEAETARMKHLDRFRRDPYYSPNLSLEKPHELAFPPRRAKPWRRQASRRRRLRILCLSVAHGHRHPASRRLSSEARHFVAAGHEVFVGGPKSDGELEYSHCSRVDLVTVTEAVCFAVQSDIDCVIAHNHPFFSVARWVGEWPKVICIDHDDLPREMSGAQRQRAQVEMRLAFSMAHGFMAPSKDETTNTASRLESYLGELERALEWVCWSGSGDRGAASSRGFLWQRPAERRVASPAPGASSAAEHANVLGGERRKFYEQLRGLGGSELVDMAYLAVLGRYADRSGRDHYMNQLRRGISKEKVLWAIASSSEARELGAVAREVLDAAGLGLAENQCRTATGRGLSGVLAKIWPGR
jgi:GT2 family glycosyltransferase